MARGGVAPGSRLPAPGAPQSRERSRAPIAHHRPNLQRLAATRCELAHSRAVARDDRDGRGGGEMASEMPGIIAHTAVHPGKAAADETDAHQGPPLECG